MDKLELARKFFNESMDALKVNDMENFQKLSKKTNKLLEDIYESKLKEFTIDEKYGDWMNFGLAHKVFEANVPKLFETKDGKSVIREYVKMVKGDKVLKEQFNTYRMFETVDGIKDVDNFISQAVDIIPKRTKKELSEAVKKVISFIREKKLNEDVEIPENTRNLFESVEYFMLNEKSVRNLDGYVKEKEVLKESLEETMKENQAKKERKEVSQVSPESFLTEMEMKYKETLSESDMELVQAVMDAKAGRVNEGKKAVYEKCKNNVLETIGKLLDESKDEEAMEKLKELKEGVERKMYNEATLVKDIMDLLQLNDTLMEE